MKLIADKELDARGLRCPEPVMLLHNSIRDMAAGQLLLILATDPSTARDFANFCEFLGHQMEHSEVEDDVFRYWIRKAE